MRIDYIVVQYLVLYITSARHLSEQNNILTSRIPYSGFPKNMIDLGICQAFHQGLLVSWGKTSACIRDSSTSVSMTVLFFLIGSNCIWAGSALSNNNSVSCLFEWNLCTRDTFRPPCLYIYIFFVERLSLFRRSDDTQLYKHLYRDCHTLRRILIIRGSSVYSYYLASISRVGSSSIIRRRNITSTADLSFRYIFKRDCWWSCVGLCSCCKMLASHSCQTFSYSSFATENT